MIVNMTGYDTLLWLIHVAVIIWTHFPPVKFAATYASSESGHPIDTPAIAGTKVMHMIVPNKNINLHEML